MSKNLSKIFQKISQNICSKNTSKNLSKNMSKNLSKFMNLLKNFSDYPFLSHRLPQKGNLPQVKKHCFKELRFKNLIIGYWQCLYYWQDIRLSEKNLCVKAPTISTWIGCMQKERKDVKVRFGYTVAET